MTSPDSGTRPLTLRRFGTARHAASPYAEVGGYSLTCARFALCSPRVIPIAKGVRIAPHVFGSRD